MKKNDDLPPLPSDEAIVAAVRDLIDDRRNQMARARAEGYGYFRDPRPTANEIARYLGVRGARRAGRGAVKGSWSGAMSGALRISPRLRSLARRGVLTEDYDRENYRNIYGIANGDRKE